MVYQESECEIYKALINELPVLICRFLLDGTLTFVNNAYCNYFKKSQNELLGQKFYSLFKVDIEKISEYLKSFNKENHTKTSIHKVLDSDKKLRCQQWTDKAIFDNNDNIIGFQSFGFDITEDILIKQKLEDNNQFLEDIFNSVQCGIIVLDAYLNINKVNTYIEEKFQEIMPLVGKRCCDVFQKFASPNFNDCPGKIVLKTGQYCSKIVPFKFNNKPICHFEITSYPLKYNNEVVGIIEYFVDISERMKQEKKLNEYRIHLENQTAELSHLNKKLKQGIIKNKNTLKALKSSDEKLRIQKLELEKKNEMLKEILSQIEKEKQDIKNQIGTNIEKAIMPILKRLEVNADSIDKKYIELLAINLNQLSDTFLTQITKLSLKLSPRELEICQLIKQGFRSKEICKLLNVSILTVEQHRHNIRKKLGIKTNLASYFQGM